MPAAGESIAVFVIVGVAKLVSVDDGSACTIAVGAFDFGVANWAGIGWLAALKCVNRATVAMIRAGMSAMCSRLSFHKGGSCSLTGDFDGEASLFDQVVGMFMRSYTISISQSSRKCVASQSMHFASLALMISKPIPCTGQRCLALGSRTIPSCTYSFSSGSVQ